METMTMEPVTEAAPVRRSAFPRHPRNPFKEHSAYATIFDILAAHRYGISRRKLLPLITEATGKDEQHAAWDLSILLSAKDTPTGIRHRSCHDGFWIEREYQHYTLRLSDVESPDEVPK